MSAIQAANAGLRFVLELCALAALASWGFATGEGLLGRIGLGIGAPLAAAVAWGLVVAPRAKVDAPAAMRLMVEIAVFVAAAVALHAAGRPRLAVALAVAYAIHRVLAYSAGVSPRAARDRSSM